MVHRVLIVEDEPNIVASLEFLLGRQGYQTQVVTDGDAVLGAVEQFRPGLVLLDVMLPNRDGFEVCQLLKALPDPPKVVMLTAKGRESEMAKGYAVGADVYVTKPFSTRDLIAGVAKLLADDS
jgi:DNA-binding response OmpR family regulator